MIVKFPNARLPVIRVASLYVIEFSPLAGGGESKGLEMGKEIKEGNKKKKDNLGNI